jgi:hypothetical protein
VLHKAEPAGRNIGKTVAFGQQRREENIHDRSGSDARAIKGNTAPSSTEVASRCITVQ